MFKRRKKPYEPMEVTDLSELFVRRDEFNKVWDMLRNCNEIHMKSLQMHAAMLEFSQKLLSRVDALEEKQSSTDEATHRMEGQLRDTAITEKMPEDEETARIRALLSTPLKEAGLSVRTYSRLVWFDMYYIVDLACQRREAVERCRKFSRKDMSEMDEMLKSQGLSFGMDITRYGYRYDGDHPYAKDLICVKPVYVKEESA